MAKSAPRAWSVVAGVRRAPAWFASPVKPGGRLRGLTLLACTVVASALVGCGVNYGPDFDYPGQPPLQAEVGIVAGAQGWDDDDPMRGREIVLDIGTMPRDEFLASYRTMFPSTAGWQEGTPDPEIGGDQLLCLVSHSDPRYDEYIEIYDYENGFASAGPHRYLVSISRLEAAEHGERAVDQCGVASGWYPADL